MLFFVTLSMVILEISSAINSKNFAISTLKKYDEATVLQNTSYESDVNCAFTCTGAAGCKDFAITMDKNGQYGCTLFKENQLCKSQNGPKIVIKYFEQLDIKTQSEVRLSQPSIQDLGYDVPPTSTEEWISECTGHCRNYVAVGLMSEGLVAGRGIIEQLDFIICGGMHADLLTDDASGETILITNTKQECPQGKVITAIYDLNDAWYTIDAFKCKSLVNTWKVNYNDCQTMESTFDGLEILHCQVGIDFYAMIAVWRRGSESGITFIKCCRLTK